jgi:hypothetical protein
LATALARQHSATLDEQSIYAVNESAAIRLPCNQARINHDTGAEFFSLTLR